MPRFYARMKKGIDDARNGRVTPLDDVYAKLSEAISEIKNGSQGADAEKSIIGKASPLMQIALSGLRNAGLFGRQVRSLERKADLCLLLL